MTYRQLAPEESYMLAALRKQGFTKSQIARALGRHRSTIGRELRRNSTHADGRYRASTAQERANGLLRQYLPKGVSLAGLTQHHCTAIAHKLNPRPRKRLDFRRPLECFNES